jgi:hypothetical protein
MRIITIILIAFWILILLITINKLYETIKYHEKVNLRDRIWIIAILIASILFFVEKFFI